MSVFSIVLLCQMSVSLLNLQVERVCPGCGMQWDCSNLHFEAAEVIQTLGTADSKGSVPKKRKRRCEIEVDATQSEAFVDSQPNGHHTRAVRRSSRVKNHPLS